MRSVLDLLTLNLWGLPWPVARGRRERKRRLVDHLSRRPYDLAGLQELWWPWRRSLDLTPLSLPRGRRDSGLALAGRLPLREEARVEHFDDHGGFDRLKRKGLLRAGVEVSSDAVVSICVTHLQAGRRHAAIRARQLAQLLRALDKERRPIVVMGDFNLHGDVDEDRRSAERLHAAGFKDVAVALSREEPTYVPTNPYVRKHRQAERFDRVYLRDGVETRLEPVEVEVLRPQPQPLSDHHPVRARIRLVE